MRRSLVLTAESARHPFRASLPPHVCALSAEELDNRLPWRMRLGLDGSDVKHFLASFCACFIAISIFIA